MTYETTYYFYHLLGSFCIVLLLSGAFCTSSFGHDDLPPSMIIVYSQTGNEVIHGDCQTKTGDGDSGQDRVTCNFADVTISPPEPLDEEDKLGLKAAEYVQRPKPAALAALEDQLRLVIQEKEAIIKRGDSPLPTVTEMQIRDDRKMLDELKKNPSKAVKDARATAPKVKEGDFNKVLNDPATGPKTKAYLGQLFAAISSKDLVKAANLESERRQQTCNAEVTSYSIDFKKIGKGKWLSNDGPQGMCHVVRIYELNADQTPTLANGLWTFVQKNITVGHATDPMCKSIANGERQPSEEMLGWKHPLEFELPCEYINW